MAVIFILSLLTLIGLFFVYRVIALDNRNAVSGYSSQISKKKSPLKDVGHSFQQSFSNLFFYVFKKKEEPKVVPIRSLREYYAKESESVPVEIDLTKQKIEGSSVESRLSASVRPQNSSEATIKVPADFYTELKVRFEELRDSHRKLERLLGERTAQLEQTRRALDAELALHQDFDKVKAWLDQQLKDIRLELAEKDKLIEMLQNPPANRIASQISSVSEEQDSSRDFVRLPADLIAEGKTSFHKDPAHGGQNKFFEAMEENQNANLFYRMPSEEDIIRDLKNKKYSV